MAAQANSRPTRPVTPLVVKHDDRHGDSWLHPLPAALLSAVFHIVLLGLLFLFGSPSEANPALERREEIPVQADAPQEEKNSDPLITSDVDPAAQDPDTDIAYKVERKAEVAVPGQVNAMAPVGILDGVKDAPPISLPAPGGFGSKGQGGVIDGGIPGMSMARGTAGGYGPRGMPLAGTFYGRSGATKMDALRDGGGTKESEAAVVRGLQWLKRNQAADGRWMLYGAFPDKGGSNDIAGTAFGLLPLLGAGKTHKPAPDNPYDKPIEKALLFLMRKQDKRTGNFGGGMYAHGLATIAMCEAYGLSQDPLLRRPAQMAVNFIVQAQHEAGGWRYSPGQAGDTSVVGWQVMALKSAQMAGLDVPEATMRKAIRFIDSCCASDEGYGYTGPGSTPTMSAVGLLCRQYLQAWGPQNLRMIKGVENQIKTRRPGAMKNMYYYYYATQVMHHFGGTAWKDWNEKMREHLIKTQENTSSSPQFGSWNSVGESHTAGRLMQTSLCLLTLEVYYRHLPLYYRDAGTKMGAAK